MSNIKIRASVWKGYSNLDPFMYKKGKRDSTLREVGVTMASTTMAQKSGVMRKYNGSTIELCLIVRGGSK